MHIKPMEESEGTFKPEDEELVSCFKCNKVAMTCSIWESSCGGYEDAKYTCKACGYIYWSEGPDA